MIKINGSKQEHQKMVSFLRIVSGPCARVTALLLIVALNWVGLLGVGSTVAYFSDTEAGTQNSFVAGELDITIVNDSLESLIGVEALGEVDYASLVSLTSGSVDAQYAVRTADIVGDADFCAAIDVEATRNGFVQYTGSVDALSLLPTQEFGAWEFEFDVPPLVPVAHGDICDFDVVFDGFLAGVATTTDSGFTDEERVSFTLTAKMVVLNEILPNPDSLAVSPNNNEWIELYNNGDTPVDIVGWQVSEISGGVTENFYTIVASSPTASEIGTLAGTTIIPAYGYAVLLFADPTKLNNTGDTVALYDASTTLLDKRSFGAIAVGKTVARSPNGTGVWFDPIPTPGESNIILPGDELLPPESIYEHGEHAEDVMTLRAGSMKEEADILPPVITLLGNNPALIPLGSAYSDFGAMVTDNVNPNIGLSIEKKNIDTSVVGTHTLAFSAMDAAGNVANIERTIMVYDPATGMPEVTDLPKVSSVQDALVVGSADSTSQQKAIPVVAEIVVEAVTPSPLPLEEEDSSEVAYEEVTEAVAETREEDIMPTLPSEALVAETITTELLIDTDTLTAKPIEAPAEEIIPVVHEEAIVEDVIESTPAIKEDHEEI